MIYKIFVRTILDTYVFKANIALIPNPYIARYGKN